MRRNEGRLQDGFGPENDCFGRIVAAKLEEQEPGYALRLTLPEPPAGRNYTYSGDTSMPRTVLALACLIGLGISARPAMCQSSRKTVILEILLPEDARLFIEGVETKAT